METILKINQPLSADAQRVVTQEQWTAELEKHLRDEKEFTKAYDEIVSRRRQLPWVKVEKAYVFEGEQGKVSLSDLFNSNNQLVIQHFMFGPDDEEGCTGCSFTADHVDCARMHFEHNNLSFAAISRAPIEKLLRYKKRMGWSFNWVSSFENDFNYDFHVSFTKEEVAQGRGYYNFQMTQIDGEELPGISVFFKDGQGDIFHTFSSYGRGGELLIGAYNYLDLTPNGRNEMDENQNLMDWVRRHDQYEPANTGESEKQSCCS